MKRVLRLVELMAGPRSTDEWERRRHRAIVFAIVSILLAVLVTTVLVVAFDRDGVGGAREDYGTEEGVSRPRPPPPGSRRCRPPRGVAPSSGGSAVRCSALRTTSASSSGGWPSCRASWRRRSSRGGSRRRIYGAAFQDAKADIFVGDGQA